MYICLCNGVTEREIRDSARKGASLHDLERCLGVGAGCGRCRSAAEELLDETPKSWKATALPAAA